MLIVGVGVTVAVGVGDGGGVNTINVLFTFWGFTLWIYKAYVADGTGENEADPLVCPSAINTFVEP
jgi:hypothetical protein